MKKQIVWGIELGQLLAFVGFYFAFLVFYTITSVVSQLDFEERSFSELFWGYLLSRMVDYSLKFIFTIPIWYLFFKVLKKWALSQKVALHVPMMCIYVFVWFKTFYFVCESIGLGHLRGSSQVWDIYIPALVYVVQFGFLHAYEYHLAHLQELKNNEALKHAVIQNELMALKAQLNPHFLYNTFNTISASVPPEQESTREMIATLADMFRYQLKATKVNLVPIAEELTFVEKYLSLEQIRFGDRLKVILNVEKEALSQKISPMLIQPLVENSLKHGLSSLIEGGELIIKIQKTPAGVSFEIADTGVGIDDPVSIFGKGVGLTNVRKILKQIHQSELKISSIHPKGTKISFEI